MHRFLAPTVVFCALVLLVCPLAWAGDPNEIEVTTTADNAPGDPPALGDD